MTDYSVQIQESITFSPKWLTDITINSNNIDFSVIIILLFGDESEKHNLSFAHFIA